MKKVFGANFATRHDISSIYVTLLNLLSNTKNWTKWRIQVLFDKLVKAGIIRRSQLCDVSWITVARCLIWFEGRSYVWRSTPGRDGMLAGFHDIIGAWQGIDEIYACSLTPMMFCRASFAVRFAHWGHFSRFKKLWRYSSYHYLAGSWYLEVFPEGTGLPRSFMWLDRTDVATEVQHPIMGRTGVFSSSEKRAVFPALLPISPRLRFQ